MADRPLVLSDESASRNFVAVGLVCLPRQSTSDALQVLTNAKENTGLSREARIHCREIFHSDSRCRRRSEFRKLNTKNIHALIADCIDGINRIGGTWWGGFVNKREYPNDLQLVDGTPFKVTYKHLAGIALTAATTQMSHHLGFEYRLAYDPDRTKIDWGLSNRMQATHFARTHPNVVELPTEKQALLELADIAAYVLVQKLIEDSEPGRRKAARFWPHARSMRISAAELRWEPPKQEVQ